MGKVVHPAVAKLFLSPEGPAVTPAVASLLALIAAIVLSMTTRINVGLVAMALA